jgi:hypothetical protein
MRIREAELGGIWVLVEDQVAAGGMERKIDRDAQVQRINAGAIATGWIAIPYSISAPS